MLQRSRMDPAGWVAVWMRHLHGMLRSQFGEGRAGEVVNCSLVIGKSDQRRLSRKLDARKLVVERE
jgi:hypothetical protein